MNPNPFKPMKTPKQLALLTSLAAVFGASYLHAAQPLNITAGTSRNWSPDAIGYNGKMQGDPWRTQPFSNPVLIQTLGRSMVNTFRYPGGTVANYWDWQNGKDFSTPGDYKLENYKLAYDQIGFTPHFVLNMLTPSSSTSQQRLTSALNMLASAHSLGLPVERVELGNEFYLTDADYVAEFPTGVEYGQMCQTWIAAIKAQFPNVKCAIVATMENRTRLDTWTSEALSACNNYDALVVHWYPQSALEPCLVTGDGTLSEQNTQWSLFNSASGVGTMLGQPNQDWNLLKQVNNLPANAEIWTTEFNLKDSNGAVRHTWAHGLFNANQIHTLLKDGRVSRLLLHNWLSSNKQAIFSSTNELDYVLVNHGQGSLATTPYQFAASGQVLQWFAAAADGATSLAPLQIETLPQVQVAGCSPYSAVYGWRFSSPATQRSILVNTSGTDYDVKLSGIASASNNLRQLSGNPRAFVTGENSTLVRGTSVDTPPVLRLPAYSVTLIGGPSDTPPTGTSPNPPSFTVDPIDKPAVTAYGFSSQSLVGDATDPDGGTLSFRKVSGPSWLTVWSNGTISGIPDNSCVGSNQFVVEVADSAGRTDQATLRIDVLAGTPPVPDPIPSRNYSVTEDTFIYSGTQANIAQTLDAFLDIRSTASASFARVPYLKFTVDELPGTVSQARLNIYSVDLNATVTVSSTSPNWSATTLTWNNRPDYPGFGTPVASKALVPGWNQIDLTGVVTSPGTYSFSLNESGNVLKQLSSSRGSNAAYLQLDFATPVAENQAPFFTANPVIKAAAAEDAPYAGQTLAGSATDVDAGSTLVYSKLSGPAWLSVATNGALSGTPSTADVGANSWQVQVSDGAATAIATLNIPVASSQKTITLTAVAAEDGWINESSETSNAGGTLDAVSNSTSSLRIGDDTGKKQYKSVVSFDTSAIPDGATIVSATLRLKRGTESNNPSTFGLIKADIQGGTGFGGATALATGDFQAAAGATGVATLGYPTSDGAWSTGTLNSTGLLLVNKTGKTQLRIAFATDDDNDNKADYLGFYSGEAATGSKPELVIVYQ